MKRAVVSGFCILACIVVLFWVTGEAITLSMPPYADDLGDDIHIEKIKGLYLVKQSAARDNNVIIYGSSELRTFFISTHPSNFFRGRRNGFQVNLVGRGSCQSLIHAINIAATGDALAGKKVVLITSPQSYVEGGIAPDLFMANFSEQQYLELMADDTIPREMKRYISARVKELTDEYNRITGSSINKYSASGIKATNAVEDNFPAAVKDFVLKPYYLMSRWLLDLKDKATAGQLIRKVGDEPAEPAGNDTGDGIDWDLELEKAVEEAKKLTDNNEFGMLNDYYSTYIGRKLNLQKDKDKSLSYSVSKEYGDLELLLDLCRIKGIEPLFVHVPLHGRWSDYTGFAKERRETYYQNVRDIVSRYDNVQMLDLTGYEYEEYFLCDVMHLGWKGWLEVDKAIDRYYHGY